MIKPTKYTDIGVSVIGISAEILKILSDESVLTYDHLLGLVISKKGENAIENFMSALCFLFAVDKINYHKNNDVIELIQSH